MITGFVNAITSDIFNGINSKEARKIPQTIWNVCRRKLDMVNAAHDTKDLQVPPGNRLELLKGNRKGYYSIRINDLYRAVFKFANGNASDVEITDYH